MRIMGISIFFIATAATHSIIQGYYSLSSDPSESIEIDSDKYTFVFIYNALFALETYELCIIPVATSEQVAEPVDCPIIIK